ncbi:MAG TPA: hypothetical protein VJB88_07655, partial [Vicinamibacteria bacterium]|nr:hypothetical protein [Vicinamibacteria bacterium]
MKRREIFIHLCIALMMVGFAVNAGSQVGKSQGISDVNVATEQELLALPHMTAAIVKGISDRRPFTSVMDLNSFLLSQSLNSNQLTELYGKAFIHVNLNTATEYEFL